MGLRVVHATIRVHEVLNGTEDKIQRDTEMSRKTGPIDAHTKDAIVKVRPQKMQG